MVAADRARLKRPDARRSGGISWTERIETLARLPLSWREIGRTYLRAHVLVRLLCLWPFLGAVPTLGLGSRGGKAPASWVNVFIALIIANVLVVLLTAARRMRGYPGAAQRAPSAGSGSDRTS